MSLSTTSQPNYSDPAYREAKDRGVNLYDQASSLSSSSARNVETKGASSPSLSSASPGPSPSIRSLQQRHDIRAIPVPSDLPAPITEKALEVLGKAFQAEATSEACFKAALEKCKKREWNVLRPHKERLKLLLNAQGHPLLISLIHEGELELARDLVQEEIAVHATDTSGKTALHHASKRGNTNFIELLLKKHFVNTQAVNKETPLHIAAQTGSVPACQILLEKGASPNAQAELTLNGTTLSNVTPLHLAIIGRDPALIDLMLTDDPPLDLSLQIPQIGSLLHIAIHFHDNDTLRHLLSTHHQILKDLLSIPNREGLTPLMLAASIGNIEAMRMLQRQQVPLEETSAEGWTPLHFAAHNLQEASVDFLACNGVNLDQRDQDGNCAVDLIRHIRTDTAQALKNLLLNLSIHKNRVGRIPPSFSLNPPENCVYQGGGPKGLAYIGVQQALEEAHLVSGIRRNAGTSAGAINATLASLGYRSTDIAKLLIEKPLTDFLDHPFKDPSAKASQYVRSMTAQKAASHLFKASMLIYRAITNPLRLVGDGLTALYQTTGVCEGEDFRKWADQVNATQIAKLTKKTPEECRHLTFGELNTLILQGYPLKHLHIFTTRIDNLEIVRLSSENPTDKDIIISDAERASMSIPGVFKPHILHYKTPDGQRAPVYDRGTYADGGMLANFPVWAFDQRKYLPTAPTGYEGEKTIVNTRTLGFSLYTPQTPNLTPPDPQIKDIGQLLNSLMNLYFTAEEHYLKQTHENPFRTVRVSNEGVGTLDFDLSEERQQQLIASGKTALTSFLAKQKRKTAPTLTTTQQKTKVTRLIKEAEDQEPLFKEINSHIKQNNHKEAFKELDFLLQSLSGAANPNILPPLYQTLQHLLPHIPFSEKENIYLNLSRLSLHPGSEQDQAELLSAIGDWHLSQRDHIPPQERLESLYLAAAHFYAQSQTLSSDPSHKEQTILHHLFEDILPRYHHLIDSAIQERDCALLQNILESLHHALGATALPISLQEPHLPPLRRKLRDHIASPKTQKAPNYKTLIELTKNLTRQHRKAQPPIQRYQQALSNWNAQHETKPNAPDTPEQFFTFLHHTYLKDIEALNPIFDHDFSWKIKGERGHGYALPFAPISFTFSEISIPQDATQPLNHQEPLLKLLLTLSGAHSLDLPRLTKNTLHPQITLNPKQLPQEPAATAYLKLHTLQQQGTVHIDADYRRPLLNLLDTLRQKHHIKEGHPHQMIDALREKNVLTASTTNLLKETFTHLHNLAYRLHIEHNHYRSDIAWNSLSFEEQRQLQTVHHLVLKPLSLLLQKKSHNLNLLKEAIESLWWNEQSIAHLETIDTLVHYLHTHEATLKEHQSYFRKLSTKPHLEPLRLRYYQTLKTVDSPKAIALANIPNRKGERLSQTLELEALQASLIACTTTTKPAQGQCVAIRGGELEETRYLKPELYERLLDNQGNIIRQHEDSLHPVCRLEAEGVDLHFKQKPSQPLMEYSVYSLTKRLVGGGAPPSSLLRFEVETPQGTKIYPVLVTPTALGTNLKTKLAENRNFNPDPYQSTLLALTQLLTRPGDGRSSNYIVSRDNQLICIDNDVSFVEPIVQYTFSQEVHFCSILFCLNHLKLDQSAIETFLATDPDIIIKAWLDELTAKEEQYRELFTPEERERLYSEDPENRFTPELLLRSGAITNLYTQYVFLQHHFKRQRPTQAIDLLQFFITLTGNNLDTQSLGPRIYKQYENRHGHPEARLKQATQRKQDVSMTTRQHLGASLGRAPSAAEIEGRELFSLERTKQEFLAYSLLKNEHVQLTKQNGNLSLKVDFSNYTLNKGPDLERQTLILDGLKVLFAMQDPRPTAISFTNCLALTPEKLLPFLHPGLTTLNLRGSGLTNLPNEIETAAPNLEELYLSGSLNLQNIQKNWTFSSEPLLMPKLKTLHCARCPNLTSVKVGPFLKNLKANNNPRLEMLDLLVDGEIQIKDTPQLKTAPQSVFGKNAWAEYYGDVGDVPPIPVEAILKERKALAEGVYCLIPKTIDGRPYTLDVLREIIQHPKKGQSTEYTGYHRNVKEAIGDKGLEGAPYWVFITKDVLPNTRNEKFEKQQKQLGDKFKVPKSLEVATAILVHHVQTGERLYSDNPWTYTCCQETTQGGWRVVVGGFRSSGLAVDEDDCRYDCGGYFDGLGGSRKF